MMIDPISIGGHLATLKAVFDKVKTNRKNLIQLAENLANTLEVLEGVQKGTQGSKFSGVPHDAVSELRIEFETLLRSCESLLDKASSSVPTDRIGSFAKGGKIESEIVRMHDKADWCYKRYMIQATSATSTGNMHFSNNSISLAQSNSQSPLSAQAESSTMNRISSVDALIENPQRDQAVSIVSKSIRSQGTNRTSFSMAYAKDRARTLQTILLSMVPVKFAPKSVKSLQYYEDSSLVATGPDELKEKKYFVISTITQLLAGVNCTGKGTKLINFPDLAEVAAALHILGLHQQALTTNQRILDQIKILAHANVKWSHGSCGAALWNLSKSELLCGNNTKAFELMWECFIWSCLGFNKKLSSKQSNILWDRLKSFTCSMSHECMEMDALAGTTLALQTLQKLIKKRAPVEESLWQAVHCVMHTFVASKGAKEVFDFSDMLFQILQKHAKVQLKFEEMSAHIHGKLALCFFKGGQLEIGIAEHNICLNFFSQSQLKVLQHQSDIATNIASIASTYHDEAITLEEMGELNSSREKMRKAVHVWEHLNEAAPSSVHYTGLEASKTVLHKLELWDYSNSTPTDFKRKATGPHSAQLETVSNLQFGLHQPAFGQSTTEESLVEKINKSNGEDSVILENSESTDTVFHPQALSIGTLQIDEKLVKIENTSKTYNQEAARTSMQAASPSNKLGKLLHEHAATEKKFVVLHKTQTGLHGAELVQSYSNQGSYLDELDDPAGAKFSEEKVREAIQKTHSVNNADLAHSYHIHGFYLDKLGDPAGAKLSVEKAIELREELHKTHPGVHNADLAHSYHIHGFYLDKLGDPAGAKLSVEKAIELREELHKTHPGVHNAELAQSYNNHGVFLEKLGDPAGAKLSVEKAIELREELHKHHPGVHNAGLAHSYYIHGFYLDKLGDPAGAKLSVEKAIELREELHKTHPGVHNAELAQSYHLHGFYLDKLGDLAGAKLSVEKAIGLREELHKTHPGFYNADLASSYHNHGVSLDRLGDPAGAKLSMEQSIKLKEALHRTHPGVHSAELAQSFFNHGVYLEKLGDPTSAQLSMEKAIELREQLHKTHPGIYSVDLARSYHIHGVYLHKLGDPAGAKLSVEKAIELREILHKTHPGVHNAELALSYNNHGVFLDKLGDPAGAKLSVEKAIELREVLHKAHPGVHNAELAQSHQNHGIYLEKLGDFTGAKLSVEKSIELREALHKSHPGVPKEDLIQST